MLMTDSLPQGMGVWWGGRGEGGGWPVATLRRHSDTGTGY